jgi:hypothetical protein
VADPENLDSLGWHFEFLPGGHHLIKHLQKHIWKNSHSLYLQRRPESGEQLAFWIWSWNKQIPGYYPALNHICKLPFIDKVTYLSLLGLHEILKLTTEPLLLYHP